MISLCIIYRGAVQTFCIEENAPRRRIEANLPAGGALIVEGDSIFPENLRVEAAVGRAVEDPLRAARDFNCVLVGRQDAALMMVRRIEAEHLAMERYALPSAASVGRDSSNSIVYPDRFLSAFHGRFFLDSGGGFCYRDESTNGTAYNGGIVHGGCLRLKAGDQLLFPPLLHVVILGDALMINRPRGLLSCSLEPLERAPEELMSILLISASTGLTHRVCVPRETRSLGEFRRYAAEGLPVSLAPLLSPDGMLLENRTRRPLITDADLVESLRRGNAAFIVT